MILDGIRSSGGSTDLDLREDKPQYNECLDFVIEREPASWRKRVIRELLIKVN